MCIRKGKHNFDENRLDSNGAGVFLVNGLGEFEVWSLEQSNVIINMHTHLSDDIPSKITYRRIAEQYNRPSKRQVT